METLIVDATAAELRIGQPLGVDHHHAGDRRRSVAGDLRVPTGPGAAKVHPVTDLGSPPFGLHPLHGVHEPTTGNPLRRPGSARRTTSIDMTRDEGSLDPVYLHGQARDLWTAADGTVTELGSRDALGHHRADCPRRPARRGDATGRRDVPAGGRSGDEWVSRRGRQGGSPATGRPRPALHAARRRSRRHADIRPCAVGVESAWGCREVGVPAGRRPMCGLRLRRPAADVLRSGRPRDRHRPGGSRPRSTATTLSPGITCRRCRATPCAADAASTSTRMSRRHGWALTRCSATPTCEATGWRRSSTSTPSAAVVDADTGVIVESRATPRVLPWQECPGAVASARANRRNDVAGLALPGSPRTKSGTSTCTHLNDLLRSIADAEALIDRVR